MEFNWSTFVLEIINFLVLIWILKRFLYKPVLNIIARRREEVEKTLAEARAEKQAADEMQQKYEGRLESWNEERQQAKNKLSEELESERVSEKQKLQDELIQQREKNQVAEQRHQLEMMRSLEVRALELGASFATRLLKQGAGQETESRLLDILLEDLEQLSDEKIKSLKNNHFDKKLTAVDIVTAYPLDEEKKQLLLKALSKLVDKDLPVQFDENSELIAGAKITLGTWVLALNLRDELTGFRELTHDV